MVSAAVVLEITFFTMQLAIYRSEGSWLNEQDRMQQLQNKVTELLTALRYIDEETHTFVSQCGKKRNKHFMIFPALYRRTITEKRHSNTHVFYGKSLIE